MPPSIKHEAPLELIRQHPALAVDLLRAVSDIKVPAGARPILGPVEVSGQLRENLRADIVVNITDRATGQPVLLIIVENQQKMVTDKQYSWPVYITGLRHTMKCPAVLLVICPDVTEARKCGEVVKTGHPGFDLVPIVVSPVNTPGRDDAEPWLTMFAAFMGAIDLEDPAGATRVLTAIQHTRQSIAERKAMTAIIINLASEAARKIMKEIIMGFPEVKNDFLDGLEREATERGLAKGLARGMAQGLAQGVAQGVAQGMAQGKAQGKAEDILKVLKVRGLGPTEAQHEQVASCTDPALLDRWFDRALTAATAADVFTD
jgi:hypothetical protein